MIATDCAAYRDRLVERFVTAFPPKHDKGQAEHGGRVYRKPNMIRHAKEEVLDLWVYLNVQGDQLDQARKLLGAAMAEQDWGAVAEAYNVLTTGNPEGEREEDR